MRDPSDTPGGDRLTSDRHESTGPAPAAPTLTRPALTQPTLTRLKRRTDFLHAAKGKRWHGKALSLHAAPARATRDADLHDSVPQGGVSNGGEPRESVTAVARVGFTLTKKVGNAVVRNRARRRLREAVRLAGDLPAQAGYDYVVIGRIDAVRVPFAALRREIVRALGDVHGARSGRGKPRASGSRPRDLGAPDEPSPRKPNANTPNAARPNAEKPRTIRP